MKEEENNNVMSRYDHKIETSLEGIEHLSKYEISRYEPLVLQESSVMNRFPRNTKDQGPVIPKIAVKSSKEEIMEMKMNGKQRNSTNKHSSSTVDAKIPRTPDKPYVLCLP